VYLFGAVAALLWLAVASGMRKPGRHVSRLLHLDAMSADQAESVAARLRAIRGVLEVVVIGEEGTAYLKVDRDQLDETELDGFTANA
jgi:hypothetical protein